MLVSIQFFVSLFLVCLFSSLVFGQGPMPASGGLTIGDFAATLDIGDVKHAGSSSYDSESQTYHLSGSGKNMWADNDEFHFLWTDLKGDFILRARVQFEGKGVDPHRKIGWIVRQTTDANSPYVDATVHGDGLTSMQFRRTAGAETEEVKSDAKMPDVIQLARKGNTYTMSVAKFGEPFQVSDSLDLDLGDEVKVGLFICSHNPDVVEKATFSNVRIVVPAPEDFKPYSDYIGSRLETMEVETGHRRVIHCTTDSLQAPNWTLDGKSLIYNRNGKLYRIGIDGSDVQQINTDFAVKNNNDHVLSFDGKRLGISHHSEDHGGKSMIYTMPVTGGTPTLVTSKAPSYLHGWSPDGNWLIYTGGRDDKYDIYKILSAGGEEIQLTKDSGLNDGSEFSPDGRVWFNSSRTGTMEIWRMNADGSEQTQITSDENNNWFPHVSPDGKRVVYLAFPADVKATDHPFYKYVALKVMDVPQGDAKPVAKTIAYIYGGQGTINVPSWSPDGKRIAFVSNTQFAKEE